MRLILIWIIFLNIGCGGMVVGQEYIHPDFLPYVEWYLRDTAYYKVQPQIDNLYLDYADLPSSISGVCQLSHYISKRVTGERFTVYRRNVFLNANSWGKFGTYTRLWIVYHELAHCTLGLGHNDVMLWDGDREVPKSMLNSYTFFDEQFMHDNLSYYVREIFTQNAPVYDYVSSSNQRYFKGGNNESNLWDLSRGIHQIY